jgi:Nucleotidyl transferase AbiEii toxin, Type IV TA system
VTKTPKNVVASVLARLRNVAQEGGISFNDILQSYVIERFLARLSQSRHVDTVLLKGALMLRVWGVPRARPTMDIDLLRRGVVDQAALVQLVEECAAIVDPSDGVIFEPTTISVEPIRDATEYVGTRIRLQVRLGNVRQTVQVDFGVGDAVHPEPQVVDYPVLLTGPPVRLSAYPVEATIAEKFEAMVHLYMQNSRMKDFRYRCARNGPRSCPPICPAPIQAAMLRIASLRVQARWIGTATRVSGASRFQT